MRTLIGKEGNLIEEMEKYRLDVLGVSEGKMRGSGLETVDGKITCVYSGVQQGRANTGVAVLHDERIGVVH